MIILGISFLSSASATLLRDGEIVAAVAEERLNRIKQWNGLPRRAVDEVLRIAGIALEDVDWVATHGAAAATPEEPAYAAARARIQGSDLPPDARAEQLAHLESRHAHEQRVLSERTPGYLREVAALGRPMLVFGHHEAHAACAFYGSGFGACAVVTADGWGEDGSSTVWTCRDGGMDLFARSASIDSLGYFYGSITKALGFIPHRHEGKVLGLAAYCREPASLDTVRRMITYDPARKAFLGGMENGYYIPRFDNAKLTAFLAGFSREDAAAAAQQVLEAVVAAAVSDLGPKAERLAVAGGVFANVKLNQRLASLPQVKEIYVFPEMGDGGLCVGAAYLAYRKLTKEKPRPFRTALLGPEASDAEIEAALRGAGLRFSRSADIGLDTARLLAEGQMVVRYSGPMEFGPRALCNRSILYNACDPSVNRWLNERLNRSEFMPFAPATLEEYAPDCYQGLDRAPVASRFMTITCDCTDRMRRQSPAAVHIDGTARPQVITRADYPDFHRILAAYHEQTGLPSVINTSFNMHEEPIVCSPDDAVRAFIAADLSYMAMGNFLVVAGEAPLP